MTKSKENLTAMAPGVKVVDVENFTSLDKKLPKGKKYKVRIGDDKYTFDQKYVTGKELLEKTGHIPVECYSLYQNLKECNSEKVSLKEKVDLSKPGFDKFIVKPPEVFHYFLDEEPETTKEKCLSANQILENGGLTPVNDYYLLEIDNSGREIPHKENPNEPIQMKCPGSKFVSIFRGEVPVS